MHTLFFAHCCCVAHSNRYPVPTAARSAVVITGASSGLGLDAALRLHSLGFVVYAGVRK